MSNIANQLSNWMFLAFVVGIPLYGAVKKIKVFDKNASQTLFFC